MNAAQQQAFVLGLICLSAAVVLAAVLAMTRVSRFGVFAVANFLLGAAVFGAQVVFDFSGWRSEILAASVIELPAVFLISWVCLAQVGGLPGRLNSPPSEPVVRRPRLRRVLGWAPAALLACWIFAVVVGFAWPSPAMQPYAPAPVRFLLFKWPISLSQTIYAGLASAVFAMAAMSRSSAPILRLRNGAFSISMISFALIGGESALIAGARLRVEGRNRREIIDALLFFEAVIAAVCFTALVIGLAFRYTPDIATAVLRQIHTGWLPARERLESSSWQAMTGGRTRGVARITYRVEEAARLAELTQLDTERAVATIQLLAMMQHPSTETGGITSETARELYNMEKEILHDEVLASKIQASLRRRADTLGSQSLYSAPLQDTLKAALELSDTHEDRTGACPLWFHLAAVASVDAGLIDEEGLWERLGDQQRSSTALEAYCMAKGRLRSQVFGEP